MITNIFQDYFCSFGIIPEAGILSFLFLLADMIQFLIQVKVTSSRPQAFYPMPLNRLCKSWM
jgi:hypothetical protein